MNQSIMKAYLKSEEPGQTHGELWQTQKIWAVDNAAALNGAHELAKELVRELANTRRSLDRYSLYDQEGRFVKEVRF